MNPTVTLLVLSWIVTTGLSWLAVRLDERWLSEERLERAWPPVSRDAAMLGFGPLAVPFHFMRTRGHFRGARGIAGIVLGLGLGLVVLAAVMLVSSLVLEGFAWAFGLPDVE